MMNKSRLPLFFVFILFPFLVSCEKIPSYHFPNSSSTNSDNFSPSNYEDNIVKGIGANQLEKALSLTIDNLINIKNANISHQILDYGDNLDIVTYNLNYEIHLYNNDVRETIYEIPSSIETGKRFEIYDDSSASYLKEEYVFIDEGYQNFLKTDIYGNANSTIELIHTSLLREYSIYFYDDFFTLLSDEILKSPSSDVRYAKAGYLADGAIYASYLTKNELTFQEGKVELIIRNNNLTQLITTNSTYRDSSLETLVSEDKCEYTYSTLNNGNFLNVPFNEDDLASIYQ